MNKIYLSWEDFGIMVDNLVKKIKKSRLKFDGVYGIPRGGLIIAVCLAHKLNIPLLYVTPSPDDLVVDDISDTGKTLYSYDYKKTACLFTTPWTKTEPDFWVGEKLKKKDWIVFPWEEECS